MKETLTDRMLHAAAHCEGMYDLLDEAKALRDGVAEIEQLRHALLTMLGDTDESDYMSAEEKRATAYAALNPNAALTGRGE